jgi:membrane protein YqaA with SNARE-associated domain
VSVKNILAILPFAIGVVISLVFLFFLSPTSIVDYIGIQNAYILMYVIAAASGLTTFNTVPYYPVMLVLANAGVNPILLGLAAAVGVMTGDSFSYLVGHQGATVIPKFLRTMFTKIYEVAVAHPRLFPVVCFFYGSLSPLSNDFITIPSGMARIPYWRVILPLGLGNIVFNITFAYLAIYAYDWVTLVFGL